MKGQTLLEVIVTSAVGILVVSALTFAVIFSLRNAGFAKNQSQATKLAQEGIEKVRSFRDRNSPIIGNFLLGSNSGDNIVESWEDEDMWDTSITANCDPCYFKINSSGQFQYIGTSLSNGEPIPPAPATKLFTRVINLSDSSNQCTTLSGNVSCYMVEKIATVIVQWTDFAGDHESKLTTILRKL